MGKLSNTTSLEFFFDYSCPWSYLAFTRVREAAMRTSAQISWKPVLLERVLATVNPELLETRFDPKPRKADYQAKNISDWADFCGLKISLPPHWPDNVELALRGAVVAAKHNVIESFSKRVFEAYFGALEDVSQIQVIVDIAATCGLQRRRFQQQLDAVDTLNRLQDNTDKLMERGGFGCPTMFIGTDMYFGNDHMPLVEIALARVSGLKFVMPGQHG